MIQNLVSCVNKIPAELVEQMNISAPTVIVNQCGKNSEEEFEYRGFPVKVSNRDEKGVGLSRNLCIENSTEEIILFSDEDIVYNDDYAQVICREFENHPEAEMLLFNMEVCEERRTYRNEKFKKISGMNCGRYPAYSIAVRRDVLVKSGVKFSELFGGGAKYSNGEDSLFIRECLKSKMKIFATEKCLGREEPRESTWFNGYTEKFFFDRGVLFYFLYGKMAMVWALRFIIVKKEMFSGNIGRKQAFKLIREGIRQGKAEKKMNK